MTNTRVIVPALVLAVTAAAVLLLWAPWSPTPIRIGVVVSADTALGSEATLAARLFHEAEPAIAGRPVELVVRNPGRDPAELRAAYAEVVAAGASIVLGGVLSSTGVEMAAAAEHHRVPMIGVTSSTAALSGHHDWFARVMCDTDVMAHLAAQHLRAAGRERVLAIAGTTNAAYTEAVAGAVVAELGGGASLIRQAELDPGLSMIDALAPDAVYVAMAPGEFFRFAVALRGLDQELPVLGSEWTSNVVRSTTGPMLEGMRFISRRGPLRAPYDALATTFAERHGYEPGIGGVYTWSGLRLAYEILAEVGADPAAVRDALHSGRDLIGGYGPLRIDASGDAWQATCYLYEYRGGDLVRLAEVNSPLPAEAR